MNKSIVKAYAMSLTSDKVIDFGKKQGIDVTEDEANLFLNTIKENADYILDGHAMEVLESKKDGFSPKSYEVLVDLYNKYKKFID